jgi:hypothetical protein
MDLRRWTDAPDQSHHAVFDGSESSQAKPRERRWRDVAVVDIDDSYEYLIRPRKPGRPPPHARFVEAAQA